MEWKKATDEPVPENAQIKTVVIEFTDGKKESLEYDRFIPDIDCGCLFVTDPMTYNPTEVHIFPLCNIRSIVYDLYKTN